MREAAARRALQSAFSRIEVSLTEESPGVVQIGRPEKFSASQDWIFLVGTEDQGLGWAVCSEGESSSRAIWNVRLANSLKRFDEFAGCTLSKSISEKADWWMARLPLRNHFEYLPDIFVTTAVRDPIIGPDSLRIPQVDRVSLSLDLKFWPIPRGTVILPTESGMISRGDVDFEAQIIVTKKGLAFRRGKQMESDLSQRIMVELGTLELSTDEVAALYEGAELNVRVDRPVKVKLKLGGFTIAVGEMRNTGDDLNILVTDVFLKGKALFEETFPCR